MSHTPVLITHEILAPRKQVLCILDHHNLSTHFGWFNCPLQTVVLSVSIIYTANSDHKIFTQIGGTLPPPLVPGRHWLQLRRWYVTSIFSLSTILWPLYLFLLTTCHCKMVCELFSPVSFKPSHIYGFQKASLHILKVASGCWMQLPFVTSVCEFWICCCRQTDTSGFSTSL